MLMVTFPWDQSLFHPGGLVSIWLGLRCQFCGDWSSQRIASQSLTGECDSNAFIAEMHILLSSVSLRTWIVPLWIHECLRSKKARMVILWCVSIFFASEISVNSFSSPVNGNSERRWPKANVGVHSYISTLASFIFERRAFVFCGSVKLYPFSLTCKDDHIAEWHLLLLYFVAL